jgi:predicted acylesterase/phospholipase RssA
LESYDPTYGYRYENIDLNEGNTDELLVILTFSGGGTRAAAFAYGVLEQLRDTNITYNGTERSLLDEVDIISSVSGGSLPAAAYGLYGKDIFNSFPEEILYRNIQGFLTKRVLRIRSYPKLMSPYYGRSDMLAEEFDRYFKNKTFGDLLERNQRPFITINSTDITIGQQFQFTQRYFDYLYSDLSSYEISRSIAASAAVPGLLTSMNLASHPKGEDYVKPPWIDETLANNAPGSWMHQYARDFDHYFYEEKKFVHLVDGGVSDNLGLMPAIRFVAETPDSEASQEMLVARGTKKVIVITVNAKTEMSYSWDTTDKIVGIFKMLSMATGTPMGDFSNAQIAYMRLLIDKIETEKQYQEQIRAIESENNIAPETELEPVTPLDYSFAELSFRQVLDEDEQRFLLELPTTFRLSRDQIDRIRAAARTAMKNNREYQEILAELRN